MNFWVSASTDIGNTKDTNQDSLYVKVLSNGSGQLVFAVLCDGMGGLEKGELASASVIHAYKKWSEERLPVLLEKEVSDEEISKEWQEIAVRCNNRMKSYGKEAGVELGTTATVFLITGQRYYTMNIGDTRAYEIADSCRILTRDQTVVAREVEAGVITQEQARRDPRRNVLLQCIGASEEVHPDMFYGTTKPDAVYMLCSDGFRHEITTEEIYEGMKPDKMTNPDEMKRNEDLLIHLVKERRERDNISVITIRSYCN